MGYHKGTKKSKWFLTCSSLVGSAKPYHIKQDSHLPYDMTSVLNYLHFVIRLNFADSQDKSKSLHFYFFR